VRVLVDTSVWSLALRRKSVSTQKEAIRLRQLIDEEHQLFLTGIILLEILQSIKEAQQVGKIRGYLDFFPLLELDRAGYENAAKLSSDCRKKGIQCSTVDALIAQTAIEHNCYLLTADKDFEFMARHCQLKLANV